MEDCGQSSCEEVDDVLILVILQVDKKIGVGQFSVVYRAKNLVDGQTVALKKIQVPVHQQPKTGIYLQVSSILTVGSCLCSIWKFS